MADIQSVLTNTNKCRHYSLDSIVQSVLLSGLNVDVTLQRHQTSVTASLHDICVRDHIADAVYPKVLIQMTSL